MSEETLQQIELESQEESKQGGNIVSMDINLIKDVDVELTAQVGTSTLSVDELFNLKQGSKIKLNEEINTPISLFIDGKLIAKGNLIAVDENFGVEVTEIAN
ncbi:FliM/FliN family flagellar motor switch protein [Kangiella sp. HZ709]|uniref:FliM/FliN family flagellar motor switch protein n=1 Tax=Kangiella sp. HZ709 TaxID=2666328 RepID=UPI0012AEF663|nr:FliM/FliN family flagellar motor switch protein [Kangiella sp. HZ709]MRX26842.1 flagellar motor switch protein FliN [Kangiella sp. HZ709]